MNDILGTELARFPLRGIKRIFDIWEFDGPVLTHIRDDSGTDYLFYWVDQNNDVNRWLVWPIDKTNLISYLNTEIDFSALFKIRGWYFCTEINREGEYTNNRMLLYNEIPLDYLPEDNKFYDDEFPQQYLNEVVSSTSSAHIERLRRTGYSFKLKKPIGGGPISTKDGGMFLTAIDDSLKAYAVDNYLKTQEDSYVIDLKEFRRKVVPLLKDATQSIMVDHHYASFEVTVNIETLAQVDESTKITNWKRSVLSSYYNDIINVDYNASKCQELLIKKFPDPEVRRTILKPIADFLNKTDCRFITHPVGTNHIKHHHKLSKQAYDRLELKGKTKESSNTTTFINLIAEVNVEDGNLKINKQAVEKGTIFLEMLDSVTLNYPSIKNEDVEIQLKHAIKAEVRKIKEGEYIMKALDLSVNATGKTLSEAMENFGKEMIKFLNSLRDSLSEDDVARYNSIVDSSRNLS